MALVSVSAPLGLEPLMSTFVRRTGARALDPTGYLSPSPSPVSFAGSLSVASRSTSHNPFIQASGDDSTPLGEPSLKHRPP
ncbi:hypothetical protein PC123_g7072 [Phytophthora cactorum]|nr:hypothetical protein PC120_g20373 [Phytophthora cactorum]KAG4057945.1 hypothetical protein PC123_g7072 [Phytophthora cactorum]